MIQYSHLLAWFILLISITQITGLNTDAFYARANIVSLLTKYTTAKEFLPVVDSSHNVQVNITMSIQRIATVDEVNQAIRLIVWLRISWNNPFLTWKLQDYNNISSIHLDNELIWKPDLALYNKASLDEEIDILYKRMTTAIVVQNNGDCKWNAPVTLLSQCKIDVTNFPYDEQICKVILGSWTYAANEIDVFPSTNSADLTDFSPTGEWDIIDAPMKRKQIVYTGGTFPDVTLYLRIKRRPLYYTLNLIIPCAVISILSFLSFVLPSNNGERVSLVITVLLAMSVYMLIVSSTLPQTSDAMPIIGTYFLCIIVEIACCLLATCLVARIREHEKDMPKWLDYAINKKLALFLFVTLRPSVYERADTRESYDNNLDIISAGTEENEAKPKLEVRCGVMDKIAAELSVLTSDVIIRQKRDVKVKKWHNAADVLDRFFLVLFMLVFGILTAAVFVR